MQLVDGSFDSRAAAGRAAVAVDLSGEVRRIARAVALPAVNERAFVEREFSAIRVLDDAMQVNARMRHLTRTAGYQTGQFMRLLDAVDAALGCVIEEREGGIKREMACWAVAAHHLQDRAASDEAIPVLRRAGRLAIDARMTAAHWNNLGQRLARYGRGIEEHTVIPYLKGELTAPVMQARR